MLLMIKFCCSEQSLEQYRVSPLTPPSETSSSFSPSERRDTNDSQVKRESKYEKEIRAKALTPFISMDDFKLPKSRFLATLSI